MKRVILLGAGFAAATGAPSSEKITQSVCSLGWTKYLLKSFDASNEYAKPNFEDVLGALEMELSYYQNRSNLFEKTPISTLFTHKKKMSLHSIRRSYKSSLDIICRAIINYIAGREKSLDDNLYQYFSAVHGQTKVYSLNYDREPSFLMKKKGIDVYEGVNSAGKFEYDIEKFINSTYSFFNLHGSVYLGTRILSLGEIYLNDEPRKILGISPFEDDTNYFTPIITGRNKSRQYLSEPFLFGHSVFSHDMANADVLDIIGYSGGDQHINAAIRYFGRDSLKINIVDYCTNPDEYDSIKGTTRLDDYGEMISSLRRQKEQMNFKKNLKNNGLYFDKGYHAHLYTNGLGDFLNNKIYEDLYENL